MLTFLRYRWSGRTIRWLPLRDQPEFICDGRPMSRVLYSRSFGSFPRGHESSWTHGKLEERRGKQSFFGHFPRIICVGNEDFNTILIFKSLKSTQAFHFVNNMISCMHSWSIKISSNDQDRRVRSGNDLMNLAFFPMARQVLKRVPTEKAVTAYIALNKFFDSFINNVSTWHTILILVLF